MMGRSDSEKIEESFHVEFRAPGIDRGKTDLLDQIEFSGQQRLHDTRGLDSDQRFFAAFEIEGVGVRIDSDKLLHRGVKVVHGNRVLDGLVAELIGRAVGDARFDPTTREPEAESVRLVIAAVVCLDGGEATELSGPHHQGLIEQSTLLQIAEQGGDRLIHLSAGVGKADGELAVVIPIMVQQVDITHPRLDEPTGHQASHAEVVGRFLADSIETPGGLRFAGDVDALHRLDLHSRGQFEVLNAGIQFLQFATRLKVAAIQGLGQLQIVALSFRFVALTGGGTEEGKGIPASFPIHRCSLVEGRQKGGSRRDAFPIGGHVAHRNVGRKILILRSECVADPTPDRREAGSRSAGVHH